MWAEREWSDIRPGDYVQGADGRTYQVAQRDALGEIELRDNHQGVIKIGRQAGKVWVWDAAMESAVTTIANHLGGTVVADTTVRKP